MDVFEFTEALRRQKKLLIVGAILIIGLVAYTGFDFDDGVSFRAKPRYESSIQIAVVPDDLDSLTDPLPNPGAMAGTAGLYATLLSTPEATAEIMDETGVQLVERLVVVTTGAEGTLGVKATARDPDGARLAALHSFAWLEQRLADPLAIVRLERTEEVAPSILGEDGRFSGAIRVEASPAFAETATGTWVSLTTAERPVTFSLADAATSPAEQAGVLEPDSDMEIALEDVFGNQIDAMTLHVPPLPEPDTMPYVLKLHLDRGALHFPGASLGTATAEPDALETLPDPELVERHVRVSWEPVAPELGSADDEPEATNAVGLALLTEDPAALETGSKRGPVLVMAALVGGFFALIALVVMVDTWSRARREGKNQTRPLPTAELLEIPGRPRATDDVKELG